MNIIIKIFQEFFFSYESKFLSIFSFFLMSFLSLHFLFFFSFFTFSSKWIDKEARMSTFEIQPKEEERGISTELKNRIVQNLEKNKKIKEINIIENYEINEFLNLEGAEALSNIRLPLFINLEFYKSDKKDINSNLIQLIDGRHYILSDHIDELVEAINLINKIKVFILMIGSLMFIIFISFLSLIIRTTFAANYKFLEIIEIMGASSKLIALNVSYILIKKIIPGILLGIVFSLLILLAIIGLFDIPLSFPDIYSFYELCINLIMLVLFLVLGIFLTFIILYFFIFNFLEKRFFV